MKVRYSSFNCSFKRIIKAITAELWHLTNEHQNTSSSLFKLLTQNTGEDLFKSISR